MAEAQVQFKSEYHGFEDDYKAEILKMRLYLSRINFEQTRYKFANHLKNFLPNFA